MKSLKPRINHFLLPPHKPPSPKPISNFRLHVNVMNFRSYKLLNPISCSFEKKTSPSPPPPPSSSSSSPVVLPHASTSSSVMATHERPHLWVPQVIEEAIEKVIYRCRFVTLLGVFGTLIGSLLCFIKGCSIVASTFVEHFARGGKSAVTLVEATDVYLLGTVMLVFGMGLYELFICNLGIADQKGQHRSNLFGLFILVERPKWLEIKSVNALKTKVGHVIVMMLLIGLLDNCKKAVIHSPIDLLCFSASVFLCFCCIYLLSMLNDSK